MNKRLLIALGTVVILGLGLVAFFMMQQGAMQNRSLRFTFTGIEDVSPAHLEGWAIFGDEKISTGKFNVDSDGTIRNLEGDLQDSFALNLDLSQADMIVITIESEGDVDSIPSGVVLLVGQVNGNNVELAYPVDLNEISGNFILATPTNGDDSNENSGIWFLQLPPPPSPGLTLPDLPPGWVYEGWAVNSGVPITTGRFTAVDGPDQFRGFSGPQQGPPFPGEDFIVNPPSGLSFPINLADGESKAVISIEPDLNGVDPTGDGPFAIKPLVADIVLGADDHVTFSMNQNLASLPRGIAIIS